jgi:hypothetical protein
MSTKSTRREAHAYTPGLKIKRVEIIRKRRTLPIDGDVLVKVGEKVDFDSIIAKAEIPGEPVMINLAEKLGVDPIDIPRFLLKGVGDMAEKGEIIAQDIALFGLIKRFVHSPISGYIERISDITGQLIIREPPIPITVSSYIPGIVKSIIPNRGAEIEVVAALVQGIFGIGGENHGMIEIAVSSPNEVLSEDKISSAHKGCIIVGGSLLSKEAYHKAVHVGAKGVITGGIEVDDLIEILGEDMGVAITGDEELPATIIITEGFGRMHMSRRTFNLLKGLRGRMAAINGATQIRAGVIRPEIIIPYREAKTTKIKNSYLVGGMREGTLVRIIREPYFGKIGSVVSLPVELQTIETESRVRVVEVRLKNGRTVTVPRANVEVIEE